MPLPFEFDFINPDYGRVFRHRLALGSKLADPVLLTALKSYYKTNPWDFITDWGCTFDPRNADIGLPTTVPFVLYERQVEWCKWVFEKWRNRENGIVEKSRELGVSWLCVAFGVTISLFYEGTVIGYGSRKELYVDKIGEPKSLFWKARKFLEYIPAEFLGGFSLKRDAPHMRITFPGTGSTITGEAGDGIGRGDRTSIYFIDEAAYIERPQLIEASLASTTNCRIDVSSARGMANPFAQRRYSGKIDVFTFGYEQDPRKAPDNLAYNINGKPCNWLTKMVNDLDPVTLAQEVFINYSASVEGIVLPDEWVRSAIGAAEKLDVKPTGRRSGALDVADQGIDLNAFAARKGIELVGLRSWSGKNSDTLYTAEKAFQLCDEWDIEEFQFDSDGIGASVRGDSRAINERRAKQKEKQIMVMPFRGSGSVWQPEREMVKGRKNEDYFYNRKAQGWWNLRILFQNTFRAISGESFDPEMLISIPENLPEKTKLLMELTQPTYTLTTNGKILIDKAPDNTRSPNLADAIMILYTPAKRSFGLFSKA